MINTLWTFGDSYTVPFGIVTVTNRQNKVLKDHFNGKYVDNTWQKEVMKVIPTKEFKNISMPGGSNREILAYVIDNLHNFKKGDQIVLGLTRGDRIEFTNEYSKPKYDAFLNHRDAVSVVNFSDIGKISETTPGNYKYLIDCFENRIENNDRYMFYEHYPLYKLALYISKSLGIDIVVWDPTNWKYYENIKEMTEGLINDPHWSPNGNIEFSKKLTNSFKVGLTVLHENKLYDGESYIKEKYGKSIL